MSKSFKLLNYCTEDNNYLKLYTELQHDFQIGDTIRIVGGYYDISKQCQMIYQYGPSLNIYNSFIKGLKILAIDLPNNAFTVNAPGDITNLIYPFGTNANPFGDPTDVINLAYNNYSTDDVYKDVYVSKCAVTNGNISKATINNGVFGTDTTTVTLNKFSNVASDLTINHIISKNTNITSCIINDTTGGVITQKLKLVEDLTVGLSTNPFNLVLDTPTINNNGFGYNIFEKITISSTTNTSTINNGIFENVKYGNIWLNKVNILGGKYGNDYQTPATIFNSDITVSNATIKNINYTNKLTATSSIIDTFIPITATSAAYTTNDFEIELSVDYNILANKLWDCIPGNYYYLSGVNKINATNFSELNTKMFIELVSKTYTFGDITSAKIVIKLSGISGLWSTFKTNNPINTFDFTKAKINEYTTGFKIAILEADSCTISSVFEDLSIAPPLYYIKNNSVLKEGIFSGVFFENSVQANGVSFGESVYLENSVQLFNSISSETAPNTTFNYTLIDLYNNTLKVDLNHSKLLSGALYNSSVYNTVITNDNDATFLNNCILYDGAKVSNDVFWNDISIQFTADTVVSNTIVSNSYFGDRKTPWVTAINGIAPLTNTQNSTNINKIEGYRSLSYYNSQEIINNTITTNGIPNYILKYDVPSLYNIQSVFDDTPQFSIVDFGALTYNGSSWPSTTNKPRILFNNILSNDADLSTRMSNKLANTTSGIYTDFPGTTPTNNSVITRVDNNFVKTKNYHNYHNEARTQRDVAVYINDTLPTPNNFPVSSLNTAASLFFLKFETLIGPDTDNVFTGTTTALPNGVIKLLFRNNGIFAANLGNATIVPACFIEIERVVKIEKNLADVVQNIDIIECTYCPTYTGTNSLQAYAYNLTRSIGDYPTSFYIKDNNNNDITLNVTSLNKFDIEIEYWITWFYDAQTPALTNLSNAYLFTGKNGGFRTKHILTQTVISDGQTYNVVDDISNKIVDNAGNRLTWNS